MHLVELGGEGVPPLRRARLHPPQRQHVKVAQQRLLQTLQLGDTRKARGQQRPEHGGRGGEDGGLLGTLAVDGGDEVRKRPRRQVLHRRVGQRQRAAHEAADLAPRLAQLGKGRLAKHGEVLRRGRAGRARSRRGFGGQEAVEHAPIVGERRVKVLRLRLGRRRGVRGTEGVHALAEDGQLIEV